MIRNTSRFAGFNAFSRSGRAILDGAGRLARRTLQPQLFELEGRRLLATFVVFSTAEPANFEPNTLRWAIEQADTASSSSSIEMSLGTGSQTITLAQGQLELSNKSHSTSIYDGPGQGPVTISGNKDGRVFQIDSDVTATITGLTITDGKELHSNAGGGLLNQGTLTLTGCTISGNSAAANGGGLENYGTASLTGCTISGNYSGSFGGGMCNEGSGNLTATGCTISANKVNFQGGGFQNGGTMNLADCTISGNSSLNYAGGVMNATTYVGDPSPTMSVVGCTISANTAGINVGGLENDGTATLTDTIVAGNVGNTYTGPATPSDILATVTISGSYNLIGTGGTGELKNGTNHNIVLANPSSPGLASFGFYGGPTETMPLLPGSAAIGAGTSADFPGTSDPITTDQRGCQPSSPVDIGAFQTGYGLVVNTTIGGTSVPSGDLSLRDAVNLANVLTGNPQVKFSSSLFATPQSIVLSGGPLKLTNTNGSETITGPATGVSNYGGGQGTVIQVDSGVTAKLSDLTITDGVVGSSSSGGGFVNQGHATLSDCTITGDEAPGGNGGGVFNYGSVEPNHKIHWIGTSSIQFGKAILVVKKPSTVLNKSITILYEPAFDFQSSNTTTSITSSDLS
jgi:fibronectin-binding autotransporter adhesin